MRKMNRNALTLVTGLIVATFGATPALAATTVGDLYVIDFGDPPHKVNQLPPVGALLDPAPRDKLSTVAGNPTVFNGFGALTSQVLKFDGNDGAEAALATRRTQAEATSGCVVGMRRARIVLMA